MYMWFNVVSPLTWNVLLYMIWISCWYEVVHVILLPHVLPSVHLSCSCHCIYMYLHLPPPKKKSKKFISHSARLKLSEGKGNGYMKCDNSSWLNTYRTAQQVKVHFKIQVHFKVYFQTLWRFTRIYLFSCYLKTNPTRDGSTVHTFRKWWRSLVMMAAMIPPPTSQTRRPNINVGGLTTEIL